MTATSQRLDTIAIAVSGLCMVHCIAVPIALALFPLVALGIGSEHHAHGLMLWIALPVSALGLTLGTLRHRRVHVLYVGAAAMALLAFASTWGHDNLDVHRESALMIVASALLAAVHVWNFRIVRRRACQGS